MIPVDVALYEAFIEAKDALSKNEVPVGCVFIYDGKIIARGRNEVNATKNATRHAEFVCIDRVYDYCTKNALDPSEIFPKITVVVTVEPCIMCLAALYNLRIKEVIFGCNNDRFGGHTVIDISKIIGYSVPMKGGYRKDEAMQLLKEFYKNDNPSTLFMK